MSELIKRLREDATEQTYLFAGQSIERLNSDLITEAADALEAKDKLLTEAFHLLQDVVDGSVSADGRGDDAILDMQIVRDIEAFLFKAKEQE